MHPRAVVAALGLLIVALVLASSPRRVGDGREYLAMGLTLARLHSPALAPADLAAAEIELDRAGFGGLSLTTYSRLRDAAGRQDFFHFWFYPAMAVPGLWVAELLGLHPNFGFAALNVVLFLGALWAVARRVSWWVAAIVFCSPAIWWIDKAHTEVFTFSLLAMAFALVRDAPWWSMVAIGAAATQNLPIAALLPAVVLFHAGRTWRDPRFWGGALGGCVLASLHPFYYEWRWRVPTPQVLQGTRARLPSLQELGAVIWDPNIGLLAHAPLLTVTFLAAVTIVLVSTRTTPAHENQDAGTGRRTAPGADVHLALVAAGVFLWSFSQTTNFNNGATCGMSRYALWLVPLALPFLGRAARVATGAARCAIVLLAVASCAWSVIAFQPRLPENYCKPTAVAAFIWTRWPALDNPLPEVFAERLSGVEPGLVPVATRGCKKVLLAAGYWPFPCVPQDVPAACSLPGALCYANAKGGSYDFVAVDAPSGYTLQRKGTWVASAGMERVVQRIVGRVRWRELRRVTPAEPGVLLVEATNVAWTEVMEGPGESIVYARQPRPGARLLLRADHPMVGWLLDPATGDDIQSLEVMASARPVPIDLPPRSAIVVVLNARK